MCLLLYTKWYECFDSRDCRLNLPTGMKSTAGSYRTNASSCKREEVGRAGWFHVQATGRPAGAWAIKQIASVGLIPHVRAFPAGVDADGKAIANYNAVRRWWRDLSAPKGASRAVVGPLRDRDLSQLDPQRQFPPSACDTRCTKAAS